MRIKRNERGFLRGDFKDANGDECSIQESSAMERPLLWLGMDEGTHTRTGECLARMHLDRRLAKQLIRHLQRFVDTGRLR